MIQYLIIHAAILSTALAAPFFGRRQTTCPPNHLIVARGSLESPGPGLLVTLADKIIAANPGTTMEAIDYPATLDNYDTSSANGTIAVQQQLNSFVQKCPNAKVAMLGFSQGAQIVGDAIAGGGIQGISKLNLPISRAVSDQVDAMVFYGDPRHNARATYNVGTATTDGAFARPLNQSLSNFASKIQSFCNARDPFCAQGDDLATHLAYPTEFDGVAAAFITAKFQGAQGAQIASAPASSAPLPLATLVRRQLSNSTVAISVSNSTSAAKRARLVVAPWSYAMSRFSTSRHISSSSSLHARTASPAANVPWANAKLHFERQLNSSVNAVSNSTLP